MLQNIDENILKWKINADCTEWKMTKTMRSTDQLYEYDNNAWPQQPGYHDQKNQPSDKSKKKVKKIE